MMENPNKAKVTYRANASGLTLEGSAYTTEGVKIEPIQVDRGVPGFPRVRNTGMYYVTVTMIVDEVECL